MPRASNFRSYSRKRLQQSKNKTTQAQSSHAPSKFHPTSQTHNPPVMSNRTSKEAPRENLCTVPPPQITSEPRQQLQQQQQQQQQQQTRRKPPMRYRSNSPTHPVSPTIGGCPQPTQSCSQNKPAQPTTPSTPQQTFPYPEDTLGRRSRQVRQRGPEQKRSVLESRSEFSCCAPSVHSSEPASTVSTTYPSRRQDGQNAASIKTPYTGCMYLSALWIWRGARKPKTYQNPRPAPSSYQLRISPTRNSRAKLRGRAHGHNKTWTRAKIAVQTRLLSSLSTTTTEETSSHTTGLSKQP